MQKEPSFLFLFLFFFFFWWFQVSTGPALSNILCKALTGTNKGLSLVPRSTENQSHMLPSRAIPIPRQQR